MKWHCQYLCKGSRSVSLRCLWFLSFSMAVRHGLWIVAWRGRLISLIRSTYAESWNITGMTLSNWQLLWDWLDIYYHHSLWTPSQAIQTCSMLPRSWLCSMGCFCKRQPQVERTMVDQVDRSCNEVLGMEKVCMESSTKGPPDFAS